MKTLLPFLAALLVVAACTGTRSLPAEQPLFPATEGETWWLINFAGTDQHGMGIHVCALITSSLQGKNSHSASFVTCWQEAGQQYAWGQKMVAAGAFSSSSGFPLHLHTGGSDSSAADWYCDLTRDGLRLHTAPLSNGNSLSLNAFWKKQQPYPLHSTGENPAIWAVAPLRATVRMDAGTPLRATGVMAVRAFQQAGELVRLAQASPVLWLDASLPGSRTLSLLGATTSEGGMAVLRHVVWDSAGQIMTLPAPTLVPQSTWQSEASGRTYPLTLKLTGIQHNALLLLPASEQQEVDNGHTGLWMGAMYVLDSVTNAVVGSGNLYLLSPR